MTVIEEYGGTLDFSGDGLAGCVRCGWRGVPTIVQGRRSVVCPACGGPPADVDQPVKVGRNDPCVCGSGRKSKKCCQR